MASIRRRRRARGDVWLVDYRDAAGLRQRLTARTKEAAENLLSEKIRERQHPACIRRTAISRSPSTRSAGSS